jgi:hypothetical protein
MGWAFGAEGAELAFGDMLEKIEPVFADKKKVPAHV